MKPVLNPVKKASKKVSAKRVSDITNGCGGNKGTKCGVEVYYLPEDSKPHKISDEI